MSDIVSSTTRPSTTGTSYEDASSLIRTYPSLDSLFRETIRYTAEYPSVGSGARNSELVTGVAVPFSEDWIYQPGDYHQPEEVAAGVPYIPTAKFSDYMNILAADLLPFAIEQTAALVKLFYQTVDKTDPGEGGGTWTSNLDGTSESNPYNVQGNSVAVEIKATDPESGVDKDGYTFTFARKEGTDWVPVCSTSGLSDTETFGGFTPGTYMVTATAVNGAGNSGGSPGYYFRVLEASPEDTTVTLSTSTDTYVAENNPALNFGRQDSIRVMTDTAPHDYLGLVRFDLTDIPQGSVINNAELQLYCSYYDGWQLYITECDSSWSEFSVTWDTMPSRGHEYTVWHDVTGIGPQAVRDEDLTQLVQDWVNGTESNYGLCLYGGNNGDNFTFSSKENSDDSKRPRLVVTYTAEIVSSPTSVAGPSQGTQGVPMSFTASGASSNVGHSVQYQFDWGDGSSLSAWGSATRSKTYSEPGEYSISVRARCTEHTEALSDWSPVLHTVTVNPLVTSPPAAPSNLRATYASCVRVDLSWDHNSDDETGFHIYAVGDELSYEPWQEEYLIGTVGPNVTEFTDTDPFEHSTVGGDETRLKKYAVYSYNMQGESRDPAEVSWLAVVVPDIGEPLNLEAEVLANNGIRLTWDANPDNAATAFVFSYSKVLSDSPGDWFYAALVNVDDLEYTIRGLQDDTTYYIRIYPADDDGYYSRFAYTLSVHTMQIQTVILWASCSRMRR